LGIVAQELREYEEARRNYQLALQIYLEFGDRYSTASTYYCLGTLAEAEENYAEARVNLQKALEIYVEYKDDYWAESAREVLEGLPE
jgi:tetratricopeptide (TPR) repeat protein